MAVTDGGVVLGSGEVLVTDWPVKLAASLPPVPAWMALASSPAVESV
ncbi:hypothetical protein [Azospirillum brasilense]|nr:hypothetical protein [Azospirillum brasilense]